MKLPFEFGTKLIFRLVFPGVILAAATMPLVNALLDFADIRIKIEYLFPVETIAWGWLVVVCDMHIYMLFEGRRYWPDLIRRFFKSREETRLQKLRAIPKPPEGQDRRKFLEAGVEIGQYPIDEGGDPRVEHPTRLGNIIEGFETYPKRKYGLDAVFYWYRLWVVLDKDLREEIDTAQAVVDSTVYLSFVLYVSALLALIYAGIESVMAMDWYTRASLPGLASLYIPRQSMLFVIAAFCVIFARVVYRISLPAHAQFGELFKSVFDQYRSKLALNDVVKEIGEVIGDPQLRYRSTREKNQIVWRYLKWHRARDDVTKENLTIKEWEARKEGGEGPQPPAT
jgi:hypothetical protein